MDKVKAFKTLRCCLCNKVVDNVGERAYKVKCADCVIKELDKACKDQDSQTINNMKGGNTMDTTTLPGKKDAYKALEPKIIEMAKAGKSASDISKELGGKPAVPKIKRILAAAGVK